MRRLKESSTPGRKKDKEKKKRHKNFIGVKSAELTREIGYCKLNKLKLQEKWNELLCKLTHGRMKEEYWNQFQAFNKILDVKNFQIGLLKDQIRGQADKKCLTLAGHVVNIEKLITLYRDLIGDINPDLQEHAQKRKLEELDKINSEYKEMFDHFKTIKVEMQARKKSLEFFKLEKLAVFKQELITDRKNLDVFAIETRSQFRELFLNTLEFIKTYRKTIAKRKQECKELEDRFKLTQKDEIIRCRRLIKENKIIAGLKNKFLHLKSLRERTERVSSFEINYFKENWCEFKKVHLETEKFWEGRIGKIVVQSYNLTKDLEGVQKKGEKVLKMMQICAKLETEKDKIFKFPEMEPCGVVLNKYDVDYKMYKKDLKVKDPMRYFWKKVSCVDAEVYELNEEKKYLLKTNKKLKSALAEYCQCLPCNREKG